MYSSYSSDEEDCDTFSIHQLRSESPFLSQVPPSNAPGNLPSTGTSTTTATTNRLNSILLLAGFEPFSPSSNDGFVQVVQVERVVSTLLSSLSSVSSAHSEIASALDRAIADSNVLVDRVARLKRDVNAKEKEVLKLAELRKEADDACRDAVVRRKDVERELRSVKGHLLELVKKVGCCQEGVKGFMTAASSTSTRGSQDHHGLPCKKCTGKIRQSKSTSANWVDGVGWIDEDESTNKVMSPSFTSTRRRVPSTASTLINSPSTTPTPYSSPSSVRTSVYRNNSLKPPMTTSTTRASSYITPPPSPLPSRTKSGIPTSPSSKSTRGTPTPSSPASSTHSASSSSASSEIDVKLLDTLVHQHAQLMKALSETSPPSSFVDAFHSDVGGLEEEWKKLEEEKEVFGTRKVEFEKERVEFWRERDVFWRERLEFEEEVRRFMVLKVVVDVDEAVAVVEDGMRKSDDDIVRGDDKMEEFEGELESVDQILDGLVGRVSVGGSRSSSEVSSPAGGSTPRNGEFEELGSSMPVREANLMRISGGESGSSSEASSPTSAPVDPVEECDHSESAEESKLSIDLPVRSINDNEEESVPVEPVAPSTVPVESKEDIDSIDSRMEEDFTPTRPVTTSEPHIDQDTSSLSHETHTSEPPSTNEIEINIQSDPTITGSPRTTAETLKPALKTVALRPSTRSLIAQFEKPRVTWALPDPTIKCTHAAVLPHVPTQPGEIGVVPGDLLHVFEEGDGYVDDTVKVVNLTRSREGLVVQGFVPRRVLRKVVGGASRLVVGVSEDGADREGVGKEFIGAIVGSEGVLGRGEGQ